MDAIIFFCKKRDLERQKLSLMYREDYLLVRVELNGGKNNWFDTVLPAEPSPPEEPECRGWLRKRRERKRRQQEYRQLQEVYRQAGEALETGIDRTVREILTAVEEAGARGELYSVYETELDFLLQADSPVSQRWRQFWKISEFRDYKEFRWVKPFLEDAKGPDFIILGTAACIPAVLEYCARRMKSLYWYLPEKDCGEEAQELAEVFYIEYGLAIALCSLPGKHPFRTLRLQSGKPLCVLDFSEEEKIFAGELKEGSIWIDFCSEEEKRRRIRRTAPWVKYDSLISRWRQYRRNTSESPEKLRNMGHYSRFS